jgi:hypothetical protein
MQVANTLLHLHPMRITGKAEPTTYVVGRLTAVAGILGANLSGNVEMVLFANENQRSINLKHSVEAIC